MNPGYLFLPDGTILRDDASLISIERNKIKGDNGEACGFTAYWVDVRGKQYRHFWNVGAGEIFNAFLDRPTSAPLPTPRKPWWQRPYTGGLFGRYAP